MPYLQDQRFNEIAQYASSYRRLGLDAATLQLLRYADENTRLKSWARDLYETGVLPEATASGSDAIEDLYLVLQVVRDGKITTAEGRAYLSQRYPDRDWSGGEYGNLLGVTGAAEVVDDFLSRPTSDPGRSTPQQVLEQTSAAATGGSPGAAEVGLSRTPFVVDDMPEEWVPDAAQQSIESLAEQVALEIADVRAGGVTFPANALDGAVIRPGSIEAHKLEPTSLNSFVSRWPQPDEAIKIKLAPAGGVDRWAEGSAKDGPGRIWDVTAYSFPRDRIVRPGPVRYRILEPGVRMGVMSLRHIASSLDADAHLGVTEVQFGMVIRGLPLLFGRPPVAMFATYVGDSPSSNVARDGDMGDINFAVAGNTGINNNDDPEFFEDAQVTEEFETNPPRIFESFDNDSTSGPLVPTADYIARVEGVSFSIPTGRTEKQLFPMLNGRFSQWFPHVAGNAAGLVAAAPPGLEYEAPTTPALVFASDPGGGTIEHYETLTEADLATKGTAPANGNYVEGPPFKFRDIGSLRPSETSFSLIVQVLPFMAVTSGDIVGASSADVHLENYDQVGLKVVAENDREVGVDIIVL